MRGSNARVSVVAAHGGCSLCRESLGTPTTAPRTIRCYAHAGIYEALELRDGGAAYMGKGVSKAIHNVNAIIGPALIGRDAEDQKGADAHMVQVLDGSKSENGWTKAKLGANAILGA